MRRIALIICLALPVLVLACAGTGGDEFSDNNNDEQQDPTNTQDPADAPTTGDDKVQELELTVVASGFTPTPATVEADVPLTLTVTRLVNTNCAREIVISEYNINKRLPLNTPVEIKFTPRAGTINYACAMNMIGGKIIAK